MKVYALHDKQVRDRVTKSRYVASDVRIRIQGLGKNPLFSTKQETKQSTTVESTNGAEAAGAALMLIEALRHEVD